MSNQPTQPLTAPAPTRESFARQEIMSALDRYPIGSVQSVREMIAGSSEAPKAVIECERGKLLLKRRARGLEHASLVGFAHEVILGCLAQGVCVPPLIGTREDHNSMCQIGDRTYELFVFIEGTPFDQSLAHAKESGKLLGELHNAMDTIKTSFEPTVESSVLNPNRLAAFDLPGTTRTSMKRIMDYAIDALSANARPNAMVHGDWHPGNMIFQGQEIVAICDFDNCRIGSRDRELAQALVYLSMKRPSADQIPAEASMDHLLAAWDGYVSQQSSEQRSEQKAKHHAPNPRLIAAMMPAVLLDEALAGISGSVPARATPLIEAAIKKAAWLDEHNPELVRALETR